MEFYDIVIVGGGPATYQLDMKTDIYGFKWRIMEMEFHRSSFLNLSNAWKGEK